MIRVLITGCSMHSNDLIHQLRENYDREEIYVVGINCEDTALLRKGVNAGYVVPRIKDPKYFDTVLDICLEERVDVILPFITAELPLMAERKEWFEEHGVKVSVSSRWSIYAAGNKVQLAKTFPGLMPRQKVCRDVDDILDFAYEIGYPKISMCCKLPDKCGGVGFCIIDERRGLDLTVYNKFGVPRYITLGMLESLSMAYGDKIIMQEYVEGTDYSMCCLAENGEVLHMLGFESSLMAFGSAMFASISMNDKAAEITREVISETKLDGNVCVDFMVRPNGDPVMLEVNPRLSATLPFIAKAGLNLPYLRCRQLLGYDVRSVKPEINYSLRMSKNYESEYFV